MDDNRKIIIFCHNYLVNNWKEIVEDQLNKLLLSGLYSRADEIYYCAYSETNDVYFNFCEIVINYDTLKKITIVRHPENVHEIPTLDLLQSIAKQKKCYILYYHTKGVTSEPNFGDNIKSWRNILEYFNIEEWKDCVEQLKNHDTVGCLYVTNQILAGVEFINYYSGNFWWSKSEYISRLDNIREIYSGDRIIAEKWIGSSYHVWFNFYSVSVTHWYATNFKREDYVKKIND